MAVSARAFFLSRFADRLFLRQTHQLPVPSLTLPSTKKLSSTIVTSLISGFDGGGVSDEFVSTTKFGFGREFSVIATMLKRIKPLDTSVISKGVSESAKSSMKQTISTMLGLLPSDQFSVTVKLFKRPLDRLIISSIITGYTLWNAEYRISLMRNFDISPGDLKESSCSEDNEVLEVKSSDCKVGKDDVVADVCVEDVEGRDCQTPENLSPETWSYIQQLESELSMVKQELHAWKQENLRMGYTRESNNDLLEYLRSLESDMVIELSRPSSSEVEDVIHQLAQNILQFFFRDDNTSSNFVGDSAIEGTENYGSDSDELSGDICTSRDYLAKLLFWCMLLGHHLRSLENRLHLSCVVGLL